MSWYTGAALILRRKFSARNFFKDCAQNKCTVALYIGQLCRYLLQTPPDPLWDRGHGVRKLLGNGLRKDVWEPLKSRFDIEYIGEFYGSTEGNATLINNKNKVTLR